MKSKTYLQWRSETRLVWRFMARAWKTRPMEVSLGCFFLGGFAWPLSLWMDLKGLHFSSGIQASQFLLTLLVQAYVLLVFLRVLGQLRRPVLNAGGLELDLWKRLALLRVAFLLYLGGALICGLVLGGFVQGVLRLGGSQIPAGLGVLLLACLYLLTRWPLAEYLIVFKGMGVRESIRTSQEMISSRGMGPVYRLSAYIWASFWACLTSYIFLERIRAAGLAGPWYFISGHFFLHFLVSPFAYYLIYSCGFVLFRIYSRPIKRKPILLAEKGS